jgi:hypothetical protein
MRRKSDGRPGGKVSRHKRLATQRSPKISTPMAIPPQNPRNAFPAWRLPCGIISAADSQLEKASESCERWEWGGAGLVVVAVIAEFVIAGVHPPYDSFWEQWGSAIADAVIAFGIIGEVLFSARDGKIQTELRKRSNDKLGAAEKAAGEANARAEEAVLALAKFRARRTISAEQGARLVEVMKKFGALSFAVSTSTFDDELVGLLVGIVDCLRDAGWKYEGYPWELEGSVEKELPLLSPIRFRAGGIAVNNVLVTYPSGNQHFKAAAETLAAWLNAEEIEAGSTGTSPEAQLVLVLIGPRR